MYIKKTISLAALEYLRRQGHIKEQKGVGFFCDAAFTFRMGAGFPGDISRIEGTVVETCLIDPTNPPTAYGQPVVIAAASQGVRQILATDGALTDVYGVTVRPFPLQPSSAVNFGATTLSGATTPPLNGIIDVLRRGYIMTQLSNPTSIPIKGGLVDVWFAASAGAHVQSAFESGHTGGSSFSITGNDKTSFNGGPDANGVVEIAFNI